MRSLALVLVVAAAAAAQAQTPAAQSASTPPDPDIAIFANVHARELSFDEVGEVKNVAFGQINGKPFMTSARTQRQNLPDPVQTHVLYRNIGIQLTIISSLPDIEQIVDEALAPEPSPTASTANKSNHRHKTR